MLQLDNVCGQWIMLVTAIAESNEHVCRYQHTGSAQIVGDLNFLLLSFAFRFEHLGKGRQIHETTLTNPCNNFNKSI